MVRYKYVTKIVELKFHLSWLRYCETCLKTIEIWDMSKHCSLGKTCPFIIIVGTQTTVSTLS